MLTISDKCCWFFSIFFLGIMGLGFTDSTKITPPQQQSISQPPSLVRPFQPVTPPQSPPRSQDEDTIGCQVVVPKSIRIFNKSGSQCVWCSAELLGKLHNVKGVEGLTDQYKHATGPGEFGRVMTGRNVKFKQVTGKDLDFIEEWTVNKKMGVGIGVNGNHVIVLCHFERNKLVKVIDNSDRSLKVQTWDWQKFQNHFSGWVFVVLPDTAAVESSWNNEVDDGRLYGLFIASKCVAGEPTTYNVLMRRIAVYDDHRRKSEFYNREAAPTVYYSHEEDAGPVQGPEAVRPSNC